MDENRRVWPTYATMFLVALFVMAGMFIFALFQLNHNLDQKTRDFEVLSQRQDQINEQLKVLEPYTASQVKQDQVDFSTWLAGLENDSTLGIFPNEHDFDRKALPLIFEFYIATNLGTYDRNDFSRVLERVQRYLQNWNTDGTFTNLAIQSLSIEIMFETDKEQPAPTVVPGQKVIFQNGAS